MNERLSGFLSPSIFAVVAVVAGIFIGTRSKDEPKTPAVQREIKFSPNGQETPDPLSIVYDYVNKEKPKSKPKKETDTVSIEWTLDGQKAKVKIDKEKQDESPCAAKLFKLLDEDCYSYKQMIASLPDPVDSQFASGFDEAVVAIKRAYEARGFILHSSWLPWPYEESPDIRLTTIHREYPGLLLFRKVDNAKDIELVWVVGENPISGLHKRAFAYAVSLISQMNQSNLIDYLGPYYSGTVQTINKNDLCDEYKLRCISGSISGDMNVHRIAVDDPYDSIHSTSIDNMSIQRAIYRYINRYSVKHNKSTEIFGHLEKSAIIYESNTGYGAGVGLNVVRDCKSEKAEYYTFPSSISQLKFSISDALLGKYDNGIDLPIQLEIPRLENQSRQFIDRMPIYDSSIAKSTGAQYMWDALRDIHDKDIRNVLIITSDDRDAIFLNSLLHHYCPNAQVFLSWGSNKFLRLDEAYHMRGVIVVSNYPLFPPGRQWTEGDHRHNLTFPTTVAQGIYNASLALAGDSEDKMIGYDHFEFKSDRAVKNCNNPVCLNVWLSMIGQDGRAYPIHTCQIERPDVMYEKQTVAQSNPNESYSVVGKSYDKTVYILLATIISIMAFLAIFYNLFYSENYESKSGLFSLSLRAALLVSLVTSISILLYPLWLMFELAWIKTDINSIIHVVRSYYLRSGVSPVLPGVCLSLTISIACWLCLWQIRSSYKYQTDNPIVYGDKNRDNRHLNTNILTNLKYLCRSEKCDYQRGANLLAITIALLMSLTGLLSVYSQLLNPRTYFIYPVFVLIAVIVAAITVRLYKYIVDKSKYIDYRLTLFVALVAAVSAWLCSMSHTPVESKGWNLLLRCLLWFLTVGLAVSLARTLLLWSQLRQHMSAIGTLPIAPAFAYLPDEVVARFHRYLLSSKPRSEDWRFATAQYAILSSKHGDNQDLGIDSNVPEDVTSDPGTEDYSKQIEQHVEKSRSLSEKLIDHPGTRSLDERYGSSNPPSAGEMKKADDDPYLCASRYVGIVTVLYLGQFFCQFRAMVAGLTIGSLGLLFGLASYPFHPQRYLLIGALTLVSLVAASIVWMMYSANTNHLIGQILRRKPEKFSPDFAFFQNFAIYVLPLIIAVVAAIIGYARVFVEPVMRLLM